MKKAKILSVALSLVLTVFLFAGCTGSGGSGASAGGSSTGSDSGGGATTFTDMTGREVSIDGAVEKIVVITPADCEIIYALGMGDAVVGRGAYCDYPAEVLDVEEVESGSELNLEQVIALAPDVIFMGTMNQTVEQVEAFEKAGIPVVVSDANDIAGTYKAIEAIGSALGKQAEAETLVAGMKQSFADLEAKVDGSQQGKTVYFEVSPLEFGLWTAGTDTFMDEVVTMLGLENAFADVSGWAEVSEEQVLERDPDYIVTMAMYYGDGPEPDEEIKGRANWQGLQAVAGGRVYKADNSAFTRPGPRLAEAAQTLYDQVYGGE